MSARPDTSDRPGPRTGRRRLVVAVLGVALLVAMALDTQVLRIGSDELAAEAGFSPETFGAAEFPRIRDSVRARAVDAPTLAAAIAADRAAATAEHGVPAGVGAVFPVRFTGVVGEGKSGVYAVAVEGMPPETGVRVQTGPAINGTDLRDAAGDIAFGDFKNQIEYQNAGAAINAAMKAETLAGLGDAPLTGRTVTVVGAFTLVNPKNWLVTPVEIAVQ